MNFSSGAKHTDRDGGGVSVGAVILRDASGLGSELLGPRSSLTTFTYGRPELPPCAAFSLNSFDAVDVGERNISSIRSLRLQPVFGKESSHRPHGLSFPALLGSRYLVGAGVRLLCHGRKILLQRESIFATEPSTRLVRRNQHSSKCPANHHTHSLTSPLHLSRSSCDPHTIILIAQIILEYRFSTESCGC